MDALAMELNEAYSPALPTESCSNEAPWIKHGLVPEQAGAGTETHWYIVRILEPLSHRTALASESVLAQIWDTPEEDEAWKDL